MKSTSESLSHPETSYGRAAEGNCVAARRGGEQPETEGRSRTKVNSIRHVRRASLLARGEACRVSGKPVTALTLSKLATGRLGCGWSENDPKRAWDKWRSRRGELSRDGVRGSIVAMKPGNSGGAKGCRKMEAGCQDRRKKTERKCLKRLSKTEKSEPDGHGRKLRYGQTEC